MENCKTFKLILYQTLKHSKSDTCRDCLSQNSHCVSMLWVLGTLIGCNCCPFTCVRETKWSWNRPHLFIYLFFWGGGVVILWMLFRILSLHIDCTHLSIYHSRPLQQLSVDHNRAWPITVDHGQSRLITVDHGRPQLTMVDHGRPQSITVKRGRMEHSSLIDWLNDRPLSITVDYARFFSVFHAKILFSTDINTVWTAGKIISCSFHPDVLQSHAQSLELASFHATFKDLVIYVVFADILKWLVRWCIAY